MDYSSIPRKYDIFNINGDPICHAVGCRKRGWKKGLLTAYGGLFCRKHVEQLSVIRYKIKHAPDRQSEIDARNEEMLFRKTFEPGHVHYINKISED